MCYGPHAKLPKMVEKRKKTMKDLTKIEQWQEERVILKCNQKAKKIADRNDDSISYKSNARLKTHDGNPIWKISQREDGNFKVFTIEYTYSRKRHSRDILRLKEDTLNDIEHFLEHSQSCAQLFNIDLTHEVRELEQAG